ncbi:TlpA family protein disulfide reductase [Alkalithermobacter paradoxus]|uniref:Thiol-disulfide oxidoreductase ResA n=1 Tax=Alkalithermobacter paradoxus TaxID=29349 RepID=A0A1V4I504_9FIRM|nr:thiol-disulfide oxidoreductase ResA [[Clostridium] thermoalcaliphilum]
MRKFIAFLIILVTMISITACASIQTSNQNGNTKNDDQSNDIQYGIYEGDKAYDFTLTDQNGESIKLSDFNGQKVFLNFWASWCQYCEIEMEDLVKLKEEHKDVKFIMVNLTQFEKISKEEIKEYLDKYSKDFTLLYDEIASVAKLYNISSIPTSYIIDEDGVIQKYIVGPIINDSLKREVKELLSN